METIALEKKKQRFPFEKREYRCTNLHVSIEKCNYTDICQILYYAVVKLVDTVMLATSITCGIVLMLCVILCRPAWWGFLITSRSHVWFYLSHPPGALRRHPILPTSPTSTDPFSRTAKLWHVGFASILLNYPPGQKSFSRLWIDKLPDPVFSRHVTLDVATSNIGKWRSLQPLPWE